MPDNTPNVLSERSPHSGLQSGAENTSASEADVARSVASRRTQIELYRASARKAEREGDIFSAAEWNAKANADEIPLNSGEYAKGIRARLGLAEPMPVNPEAKAAAEYGIAIEAKPDDYKPNTIQLAHAGVAPENIGTTARNLKELGAAMGFAPDFTPVVLDRITEVAISIHKMDPAERANWVAQQEELGLRMAGSAEQLKAWKANAKAMLSVTQPGRNFAESPIVEDVWLMRTLWNLKGARDQYAASKK